MIKIGNKTSDPIDYKKCYDSVAQDIVDHTTDFRKQLCEFLNKISQQSFYKTAPLEIRTSPFNRTMEDIICDKHDIQAAIKQSTLSWSCAEIARDFFSAKPIFTYTELPATEKERILYLVGYTLVIILSTILNSTLIIYILMNKCQKRAAKTRRPRTDNYIFSLAISDLMITFLVLPFNIYRLESDGEWKVSEDVSTNKWACPLSAYVQSVAVLSSMFVLTALSIDRLVPILYSYFKKHRNFNRFLKIIRFEIN